ncbi:MAG: zf-HC2 domain-containing protein [Anaerolineae bacterium]|nr:zf-HC2 domain-containing protein [Anaerolineae bacterium]
MEHDERYFMMMMEALDGKSTAGEHAELQAHLRECADCAREWQALLAIDALFRQTPILMPAVDFAERTLARLPDARTRRLALGAMYVGTLMGGLFPLLVAAFLVVRYAPLLSQPALLGSVWATVAGASRIVATVIEALFAGAGHLLAEQPALIGWYIILAGLVFLSGSVFQWLLKQPFEASSRN